MAGSLPSTTSDCVMGGLARQERHFGAVVGSIDLTDYPKMKVKLKPASKRPIASIFREHKSAKSALSEHNLKGIPKVLHCPLRKIEGLT